MGMVDVTEGKRGGENQATTHNRTRLEMREDGFTARVQLTSSAFSGNIYWDCRSLLSIVSTITHSLRTHCRYEHYA